MRKTIIGLAVAAAVASGLYAQGVVPWSTTEPGHAASRDAPPAAASPATAKPQQARDDLAPTVTVVRARRTVLEEKVLVSGTLVPRLEVLVAPEVEGLRVLELLAEEGDRVTKGQVIARLEQESLKAQLAQNEASLARAIAAIAQARSNIVAAEARNTEAANALDRARPLKQSGVLSDSVLDQRESAARTAAAQLRAANDGLHLAEAELAQAEAVRRDVTWRLSRTELRAPVDGVVSRRNGRIGAVASGSAMAQPMFNLIADGEVELEVEIPEADLARLEAGQPATVTVAANAGVPHKGTVRLVMPEVDKLTRQGKARIALGNTSDLRIGGFGRGVVLIRRLDVVAVPAGAVLYGSEGAYVLAVDGDRVVSRRVKAGLQSGGLVGIEHGLAEGAVVVARSGTFLRSGDRINAVESRDPVAKAD